MRTSNGTGPLSGPSSRELLDLLDLLDGGYDALTSWCLPPGTAVHRARRLLRSLLTRHITDQAILDDLDLVVCELATNACRHACGPCELRVLHHNGTPVIGEVADSGSGLERVADHLRRSAGAPGAAEGAGDACFDAVGSVEALAEGGRGLGIVAYLSQGRCGVRTTTLCGTGRLGKSVWFAIPADRGGDSSASGPRGRTDGGTALPPGRAPSGAAARCFWPR